ncbi:MAG TPA: HD-GYP domain-containing protein [Syntrophales bacterium]|nr:HD-GYP domain-containing protein [Syntrophales bacterium]
MRLPVEDLKVGMFVKMPLSWHEHPFLKNAFLVESEREIALIRETGLQEVEVDLTRSRLPSRTPEAAMHPPGGEGQGERGPVVPAELLATIKERGVPAEKRAVRVWENSLVMMKNLLDEPTGPRIKEAKEGIAAVINLILNDEDTTHYLINITEHDFNTYTHCVNVGVLGVALAKAFFGLSSEHDLMALGVGFFLHDLGKVKVDPAIINKPSRLTEEEMREMRRHPAHGYRILLETRQLTEESRLIVLQHHERRDGTGYPRGLRGDEIHIYGRLCSLVDVYDALTADRPYKSKLDPFSALKLMREEMIGHFQRDLFERFVLMFRAP